MTERHAADTAEESQPFSNAEQASEAISTRETAPPAEPSLPAHAPSASGEPFVLLHTPAPGQILLATAALTFTLVVLRFEAVANLGTLVLGGWKRDAGLYFWLVRLFCVDPWNTLATFDTPAFFPYGRSLAWSDNFILPSLAGSLLCRGGLSEISSYNLVLLAAQLLNGLCAFLLTYQLSRSVPAALLSGVALVSSPVLGAHLGHPQLQFAFFFPLGLLVAFRFLEQRSRYRAFFLGVLIPIAFATTVYYALLLVALYLFFFSTLLLLRPKSLTLREWGALFTGGALGALPVVLFLPAYFEVQSTFGKREIYEAYYFSASALSYLSASPLNLLYGATSVFSHDEARLLPGCIVLALCVTALFRLVSGSRFLRSKLTGFGLLLCGIAIASENVLKGNPADEYLTALLLWCLALYSAAAVRSLSRLERDLGCSYLTNRNLSLLVGLPALGFFVLSFGPLGNPELDQQAIAPFRIFFELFPGFHSLRAIGRAGIVTTTLLTVLAGLAAADLVRRRKVPATAVLAFLPLIVLEGYMPRYQLEPPLAAPGALKALPAPEKDPGALIVLPFAGEIDSRGEVASWGDFAEKNVAAMHWALGLGRPVVNGYSGQRTKLMREFPRALANFPGERSLAVLRSVGGLRFILVTANGAWQASGLDSMLTAPSSELSVVEKDSWGNILLRFTPRLSLGDRPVLWVPSRGYSILTGEFQALFADEGSAALIAVSAPPHFRLKPFTIIPVAQDGRWHRLAIPLPVTSDTVRPLRLQLSVQTEAAGIESGEAGADKIGAGEKAAGEPEIEVQLRSPELR